MAERTHHNHEDSLVTQAASGVEEIAGLEMFSITSVGIDIGSSTSHLIFSRLTLRREGAASRFVVTDRQVIYRSPIMLTPYLSGTLIDSNKISEFIHSAYAQAGFTPEEVDTGAVVITGEALKKENAEPITQLFARESGKFICASAGPNHEALLAAHGCGAVALSRAKKSTVLNVDMGGGTTKLSLIRNGVVIDTAAISVGARLIAFDDSNMVRRLEEPAKLMLQNLRIPLEVGDPLTDEVKESLSKLMAGTLLEVIKAHPLSPLTEELLITEPLDGYLDLDEIGQLVFSGGVSEYIYGRDSTAHGDLGPQLGCNVREGLLALFNEGVVLEPPEGIRATVIGACEYTVQASGTTGHLSGVGALPAFNLQVVCPVVGDGDTLVDATHKAMAKFDLPGFGPGLALALSIGGELNYRNLLKMAESISALVEESDDADAPLFIILQTDVAKSLGGILKEELQLDRDLVVVDGIDVGNLDYVDIGRPMGVSEVVPVTVKSLVFQAGS